jgi:AcrR family transcriptional regulator
MPTDKGHLTRERIRLEALQLFAERGVSAVSVRDIAGACGMTAANLYAHYKSKDALVSELFHEGYTSYGRRVSEAASHQGFHTQIKEIVNTICGLHAENTLLFRFLVMTQHDFLRFVERDGDNPVEVIRSVVAQAMERGDVPARDPDLVALAVVGIIVQAATGCLYGRLDGGLLERAGDLADMCWKVTQ